jgi:hypothetical protein
MDELTLPLCASWARAADAIGRDLYIVRNRQGQLSAFTNPAQARGEVVAMIKARVTVMDLGAHGLGAIVGGPRPEGI